MTVSLARHQNQDSNCQTVEGSAPLCSCIRAGVPVHDLQWLVAALAVADTVGRSCKFAFAEPQHRRPWLSKLEYGNMASIKSFSPGHK